LRPWQHAFSSSGTSRLWQQDLEIHEFLDMTKTACADRRHRLVLHSVDLGFALAEWAFPTRPEIKDVVHQHVVEDLGSPVTLQEWLEGCNPARMPVPMSRRLAVGKEGIVELVAGRLHPACAGSVASVYELLTLPLRFAGGTPILAYGVLMNSFGLALVRRLMGPPQRVVHARGQVTVDFAWIAEALIFTTFGRIPDLAEVVRSVRSEPGKACAVLEKSSHVL
jgi:hypothetical protein